jgi:superfamily II RNA helicase
VNYPRRKRKSAGHEPHQHVRERFEPKADRQLKKIFAGIGTPPPSAFIPDDFQLDALEKIQQSDVLVSAPTGSGKTWIAVQAMKRVLAEGRRAWYASPLKALSNSKYHEFCSEFGQDNVGVLTGDRKENTGAHIIVGTTEILRNQLYDSMAKSTDFRSDLVVLDEAHYLGDRDRGVVWEEVMIYLPGRVRLLMLSATIPNDAEIAAWLSVVRKHPCTVVHSERRPVPIYPLYLLPDGELVPLSDDGGISPKIEHVLQQAPRSKFRQGSAISYEHILETLAAYNLLPAIFFLKSRMECNNALLACKRHMIKPEHAARLRARIEDFLKEYPFLERHPQLLYAEHHGICAHHGGQLPHWKIVLEKLMNEGYLDAIFSTSTVAAGVNFPARTVVLVQSDRFNGREFVSLSASDLHQATGRAGRRGKDKIGFAVIAHGPFLNPHLIDELFSNKPEPIESQITINFSMALNLLLSQSPDDIRELVKASFAAYQRLPALQRLEASATRVIDKVLQQMKGAGCQSFDQILERTELRRVQTRRLSRTKKKRKNYIKACMFAETDVESNKTVEEFNERIHALEQQLQELPCGSCPACGLCYQDSNSQFVKQVRRARELAAALEESRSSLWRDFQRHLDFLVLNGYVGSDGKLTEDGIWASKLRLDQPLIIAELIRKNMLGDLAPELLAGIIAIFVNDKFKDIDLKQGIHWDKRPLLSAYYRMKSAVEDILALKKEHGFYVPQMQFWPAAALYNWTAGESWERVIELTSIDEGDLAMLVFRTADNLRQIASLEATHPVLAAKARSTIDLLLREPMTIPT